MDYLGQDLDSTDVSSITKNLINKLSSSIGWTISLGNSSDSSAVDTDNKHLSTVSHTNCMNLEYKNQCQIFMMAVQAIKDDAPINKIDTDWMALFFDRARLIYDKDSQRIWEYLPYKSTNQIQSQNLL